MSVVVSLLATGLLLACSMQAVSDDGEAYVGPEFPVTVTAPSHSEMNAGDGLLRVDGIDGLGIGNEWLTSPNFHGSVALTPVDASSSLTGLLIPHEDDDGFALFWADTTKLRDNGAPISVVSGHCEPTSISETGGAA